MSTVRASLWQILLRALALGLLALGTAGAQGLVLAVHGAACACASCGAEDEAGGCCAPRPEAPTGTWLEDGPGGCVCTPLPAQGSSLLAWMPDATGPKTRGAAGLALGGALPLSPGPAWMTGGEHAPPRARGRVPAAVPRLCRSGGERAAWLGCARL